MTDNSIALIVDGFIVTNLNRYISTPVLCLSDCHENSVAGIYVGILDFPRNDRIELLNVRKLVSINGGDTFHVDNFIANGIDNNSVGARPAIKRINLCCVSRAVTISQKAFLSVQESPAYLSVKIH